MCNCESQFIDLGVLTNPITVTLGDRHTLRAVGRGKVVLRMHLPNGKMPELTLYDVLFVPGLAFNLLSVTATAKRGKMTTFSSLKCEIKDARSLPVATGTVACTISTVTRLRSKSTLLVTAEAVNKTPGIAGLAIWDSEVCSCLLRRTW